MTLIQKTLDNFLKMFVKNVNGFEVVQAFPIDEYEQFIIHALEECERETREEVKEQLTTKLNLSEMLPGWEKWWVNVGNGRYVEKCIDCENSQKIIDFLSKEDK